MNMNRLPLSWKWFSAVAAVLVTLLVVINVSLDIALPPYLVAKIHADLERDARLVSSLVQRVPAAELNAAVMVFNPDNNSLISEGPFISGRIDCSLAPVVLCLWL